MNNIFYVRPSFVVKESVPASMPNDIAEKMTPRWCRLDRRSLKKNVAMAFIELL
jgi:hypothetical protein